MKLESLKTKKFESFKENEISNAVSIIGGYVPIATCLNGHDDSQDYATSDGHTDGGGKPCDFKVS